MIEKSPGQLQMIEDGMPEDLIDRVIKRAAEREAREAIERATRARAPARKGAFAKPLTGKAAADLLGSEWVDHNLGSLTQD